MDSEVRWFFRSEVGWGAWGDDALARGGSDYRILLTLSRYFTQTQKTQKTIAANPTGTRGHYSHTLVGNS